MQKANKKPPVKKEGTMVAMAEYVGPLPPPSLFAQYGHVVSDAPERILKVFEEDSLHTREMQTAALKAEVARDKRGQWMAFIIIMGALGLTGLAITYNQPYAAGVSGLATIILAATNFFKR